MKIKQLVFLLIFSIGCQTLNEKKADNNEKVVFDAELAAEVARRVEVDQTATWLPEGKFKDYTREQWSPYKDSVLSKMKVEMEKDNTSKSNYAYLVGTQVKYNRKTG